MSTNVCELAACTHETHYLLIRAVNTKAEVRFHIESADWIPLRVKERLKSMVRNHQHYIIMM